MANSRIYLKSEAGGTTVLSRDTTANSGNLVLPAGGNVASVDTAVTDNAIARYDSTTGKLQNSGVVIDDNGNVGIGTSNPLARLHITSNNSPLALGSPQFILSGNANKERISVRSSSGGSVIVVGNCGGTIEAPSSVTSGMFLGSYQFGGYAGSTSAWTRGAQIAGYASGNWTDTSFPTDISFMTVPSGSTTLTERMRIDTAGNVAIGNTSDNNTRRLGFTTAGGGSSAIESVTVGVTNQDLVFKTTYVTESEKMKLTGLGSLLLTSGNGALGYGTGAGGTVTQLTSKTTAVTLNKPSGDIIMSNSPLAAGFSASFGLFNSLISLTDTVTVSLVGGASNGDAYRTEVRQVTAGQIVVRVVNISGGSLSEALVIHFNILKGANS